MNFMAGRFSGGQGTIPALNELTIPAVVALPADGSQIIVGVRPQHLAVREAVSSVIIDIRERLGGVASDYLDTPSETAIRFQCG